MEVELLSLLITHGSEAALGLVAVCSIYFFKQLAKINVALTSILHTLVGVDRKGGLVGEVGKIKSILDSHDHRLDGHRDRLTRIETKIETKD
tara:strand:+ start:1184 stop:1459 length:276 start_codon:yes stop_codon:yes gene_type:complete